MWQFSALGYFGVLTASIAIIVVDRCLQERWPHTKATVLPQETASGDMLLRFDVPGRSGVTAQLPPEGSRVLSPGTVINIAYDPADPSRIVEVAPAWTDALWIAFFACLVLASPLVVFAG